MRLSISLFAFVMLTSCATSSPKSTPPKADAIDAEAARLMKTENVQGVAIAGIENGRVVHVAAYGHRIRGLSLTTDTIMYGASLTKTAVTYKLLQIVDEGKLDLAASVADLLPRPLPEYDSEDYDYTDLAGDERWRALTPRILLTHMSGFANFRWLEPDKELRFHSSPGTRHGYSGNHPDGFKVRDMLGLVAGFFEAQRHEWHQ